MSEATPVDDIAADAIRYRLMLRNEAEATLQALTVRILRAMSMPNGSQIHIEADGSMVAMAPGSTSSPTGSGRVANRQKMNATNPSHLHELLLACGFDPAQLRCITQQSMGTGLSAITQATDPAERARAIVDYATRYTLLRELTATVLTAGADKPVMQNILLDDNMTLEDDRNSTTLDVVRLEHKVERLTDKVDGLTSVVANLSATMNTILQRPRRRTTSL